MSNETFTPEAGALFVVEIPVSPEHLDSIVPEHVAEVTQEQISELFASKGIDPAAFGYELVGSGFVQRFALKVAD